MDNSRKSPPRAEIYSAEFEEGVRRCYEYAKELIESAEILRDQGKHSPARALAIQAEEELGKAAMLLDEIAQNKPWITERRWDDKYRDHEHKARRAHLAVQKNVVKVTEWEPSIHAYGSEPSKKVVTEGDQMKRYAKEDIERKFRSLYVDHGLIGGLRRWISPLDPNGFYSDSDIEIGLAKDCRRAVEIEAEKHGITL